MITKPGAYYWRHIVSGELETAKPGVPDRVVCRRVADFPGGQAPVGAGLGTCSECGERVAFNPAGPHLEKPRLCMQCTGVEPLPFPTEES